MAIVFPSWLPTYTGRDERNEAMDALREEIVDGFLAEDEMADPKAIRGIICRRTEEGDSCRAFFMMVFVPTAVITPPFANSPLRLA